MLIATQAKYQYRGIIYVMLNHNKHSFYSIEKCAQKQWTSDCLHLIMTGIEKHVKWHQIILSLTYQVAIYDTSIVPKLVIGMHTWDIVWRTRWNCVCSLPDDFTDGEMATPVLVWLTNPGIPGDCYCPPYENVELTKFSDCLVTWGDDPGGWIGWHVTYPPPLDNSYVKTLVSATRKLLVISHFSRVKLFKFVTNFLNIYRVLETIPRSQELSGHDNHKFMLFCMWKFL